MKSEYKKYLPFIRAGMQEAVTYRVNFFLHLFGNLLGSFVMFFLWRAIFHSSSNSLMNGFTFSDMVLYVFLSFFTRQMTMSGSNWSIGDEIKDGSISMRMLKPLNFSNTFLFEEVGRKIIIVAWVFLPSITGIIIYQYIGTDVTSFNFFNLMLYIIDVGLAYLITFYFNICFGYTAFIFKNSWGINIAKNAVTIFMSGSLIPLTFFPDQVSFILQLFPFASFIYTPVMFYMGRFNELQVIYLLLLQIFWLIFFWLLTKIIWKVVMKYINIQGG